MELELDSIRVRGPWGPLSNIRIYGGPWMEVPDDYYGICLAPEALCGMGWYIPLANPTRKLPEPSVEVDVMDYSTPKPDEAVRAAMLGLRIALFGGKVYVGCGFGLGRTGTMLGLMMRIAGIPLHVDPVEAVREQYCPKAIETDAQKKMVRTLDVRPAIARYQHWIQECRWSRRPLLLLSPDDLPKPQLPTPARDLRDFWTNPDAWK